MKKNAVVIDLSHPFKTGMPVFPGDPFPEFRGNSSVEKDAFRDTIISMSTHTGTHLDCPGHVFRNGKSVSDFEADHFYGKGCLIDCTEINDDNLIEKRWLREYESQIKASDFVLLYTGWSNLWEKPEYFNDFPVLDKEAAQYLLQFDLKGIGVDAPSVDSLNLTTLEIHHILLSHNIIIIENLTDMAQLKSKSFYFCCFPLKIEGSDGSPVRATAII